ncbi:ATP-binding protein [Corynebacterium sp. 13CS0277]|uniref:precorrin-3B C(17)-methyltransferase n=1 Tax=Corynebacterium sp. 13CS0277 TaxID=2071994 RepID=UPI000D026170|nr:precorrin-3B C(17)-methyltransferase [Corynebacterium sp. 13CS0277]PRQ12049.1 ATP-binding protein [Corynebacterium sp. 13CS0277]
MTKSPESSAPSPAPAVVAAQQPAGRVIGVGVGPGDPELLTVAATKALAAADVVAYHAKPGGRSSARAAAAPYLPETVIEEFLEYPVTTGSTAHPGGYAGALADFYAEATARLGAHLAAGRTVVILALGDPMLYSSYQHLHRALCDLATEARIIPGISAMTAAADVAQLPLAEDDDVLTILAGTMEESALVQALSATDSAVIMKLGRTFPRVLRALAAAGMTERAVLVERIGMDGENATPITQVDPEQVPYFSVVVVPSPTAATRAAEGYRAIDTHVSTDTTHTTHTAGAVVDDPAGGEVVVLGLGPGAARWTTPEVTAELAQATDIIGYTTYVNRVPLRPGQRRHPSDNKVEAQRALMALDLAARGRRVAVVSSGDPGVFAMAAAVLEEADRNGMADIPVRVVPGMTAAQAVASRVGAPLGHDFGMISLSNRLKPWEVVERRIRALAGADMAFACYNPASKERRDQVAWLKDIVLEYQSPDTPVIVARAVGSEQENVTVCTLGAFDPTVVDMRTMVIIGASTTTVFDTPQGPRVYTSRTYGPNHTAGTPVGPVD